MLKQVALTALIIVACLAFIVFCIFEGQWAAEFWLLCQPEGCKESILQGEDLVNSFRLGGFIYATALIAALFVFTPKKKNE